MKVLELHKKDLDYTRFIKRSAEESDYDTLVSESVIGVDNGEIKFVYQELDWDTTEVVEALKRIKYAETARSAGLMTKSRIFGWRPRVAMRADFCSPASLIRDFPEEHKLVANLAVRIEGLYKVTAPERFERHKEITDTKVKDSFRVAGSVFTSGIINKNNPLRYHFDSGNFTEVFSCMPVFKSGIKGGHLAIPEYGIGLELKHNSILMFDGQNIMHGVTPIKYASELSFRFSVVYYSLKNIWNCMEIDDELARAKSVYEKRARNRSAMTPEYRATLEKALAQQKGRKAKYENTDSNTK